MKLFQLTPLCLTFSLLSCAQPDLLSSEIGDLDSYHSTTSNPGMESPLPPQINDSTRSGSEQETESEQATEGGNQSTVGMNDMANVNAGASHHRVR